VREFVSHELHVLRLLCERMVVLRTRPDVEQGRSDEPFERAGAAYTAQLIAALPYFDFARGLPTTPGLRRLSPPNRPIAAPNHCRTRGRLCQ
jgi:ABC-type dipeptide/oligopeptide/nickel transport system ATPase component